MRFPIWKTVSRSVSNFLADELLTRGAAIAFYTVTSIGPILLIVISIAGLFFGREAAVGSLTAQLSGLMGEDVAKTLEAVVANTSDITASRIAAAVGFITLIITASGAFGELQSALNVIWKSEPKSFSVSRLLKARITSLGLVVTLGFLLVVSLVASAAISALSERINQSIAWGGLFASVADFLLSCVLITLMFAAVYKVLPDRPLRLGSVFLGAAVSALLFVAGKFLIGFYIGKSGVASAYGAAGSLIVLLLWVYYSVQIFLFGAELAKTISQGK